jgi:hypothetical protein
VEARVRAFDLEDGAELPGPTGYHRQVAALALSPDGKTLLTGGVDHRLALWEVVTGREIYRLPNQEHAVGPVAFSPDGRLMASSAGDWLGSDPAPPNRIRLWDAACGEELGHFDDFSGHVLSLAFTTDGNRLVSGMQDSTLLVWDLVPLRKRLPPLGGLSRGSERLWAALAGDNARAAYEAIWVLSADALSALRLFREQGLCPVAPPDSELIGRLIRDQDSSRFPAREAATRKLREMESLAVPALRRTLAGNPSPELRRRAEALLAERGVVRSPEVLRRLRAIQVLERIASAEARALLTELASGAPEARPTREAKASLDRLARRFTEAR